MGVVSAQRVHGPGSRAEVAIAFEGEHLCGNGRFSNVYAATMTSPASMRVAIKNVWENKDSPPKPGLLPEISILSQMTHPNVVDLLYHYVRSIEGQKVNCLVLEFLPQDAQKLRDKAIRLDLLDAKLYSHQLFSAVGYISEQLCLHLDIKPANILLNHATGVLKLGDFGNAQTFIPGKEVEQTQPYQVTRYYRAPEIVFGTKYFTTSIDTWSAACCMYGFITGKVLFKGRSTHDQMKLMAEVFGYPSEEDIKAMRVSRPRIGRSTPKGVAKFAGDDFPKDALDVLTAVFVYNPVKRRTARECSKMPFFAELFSSPEPIRSNGAPLPASINGNQETKKKGDDSSSEEDKGY